MAGLLAVAEACKHATKHQNLGGLILSLTGVSIHTLIVQCQRTTKPTSMAVIEQQNSFPVGNSVIMVIRTRGTKADP